MWYRWQGAFSLIEVLLSLLILSVSLLSLAHIEIAALRYNRSAYFTSVADAQASALVDCLLITHSAAFCEQEYRTLYSAQLPKGQCFIRLNGWNYHLLIGWFSPESIYQNNNCTAYFATHFNCLSFTGKL